MFEVFDYENMPPVDEVWPGESEIFDWAKNPPIETDLPVPEVELTGKHVTVGALGFVAISASSYYVTTSLLSWAIGSGASAKPASCPELPAKARLDAITSDIVSAPTKPTNLGQLMKEKGLQIVPPEISTSARKEIALSGSPQQATKAVDSYTYSNFGFHTQLDKSVKFSNKTAPQYKQGLLYFVEDSSMMPIGLIKGSVAGLYISDRQINTFQKQRGDNRVSTAMFDSDNHKIYSRPLDVWYSFNHELEHALDLKICKDIGAPDTAFTRQNPSGFRYSAGNEDKKISTVSYTTYGETDPGEDRAEILSGFLNWSDETDREWLSPNQLLHEPKSELRKTVAAKLVVILERLDRLVPGSARYLSSLSRLRHNEPGPDAIYLPDGSKEIVIKGSK